MIKLMAVLSLGGGLWASTIDRMFDPRLTGAQRNDACFAMRGDSSAEARAAMRKALAVEAMRACAAANLGVSGAVEELREAWGSDDFAVRAAAVRELGMFQRADLLGLLADAASDGNLLVAANGMDALGRYGGPEVVPYLEKIAAKGGIVGMMALNRLGVLDSGAALGVARRLLAAGEVADRVSALRAIGEYGGAADLAALRTLAARKDNVAVRQRGFGLMPPIDLPRAAAATIEQIEKRMGKV